MWTIGDRLRKARETAGLEQQELADIIGISRNTVSNYEKGRTQPRMLELREWSAATAVDLHWLVADWVKRPRQDSNLRPADYIAERYAWAAQNYPGLGAPGRVSRRRQQRRRCDTLPTTSRPVPAVSYLAEWRASSVAA